MKTIENDALVYTLLSVSIALLFAVTIFIVIYFFKNKTYRYILKNKELELTMQHQLLKSVIETQEQERIRIARDLHDEIASKLNAIAWNLHLANKKSTAETTKEEIDASLQICTSVQKNIKQTIHHLIPLEIENFGLDYVLKDMSHPTNYQIHYENDGNEHTFDSFSFNEQTHLLRIIQELLNNSIKHGKSTTSWIHFKTNDNYLELLYSDNGIGCKTDQLKNGQGIGIKNILLRSKILNGNCNFNTEKSFSFTLNVPKRQ
ncbi:MAG TPA: histidine kinase [Brumimicrobium sp.]|nr:histidine kinase [Flavobacterium sp.]HTO36833.1 histidine kinase [Brumimicrobium sp.]